MCNININKSRNGSLQPRTKCTPSYRKQSIMRYKQKRDQRNFEKRIKYNCRKTLADSRPRVRGRFARKEEEVRYNLNDHAKNSLWTWLVISPGKSIVSFVRIFYFCMCMRVSVLFSSQKPGLGLDLYIPSLTVPHSSCVPVNYSVPLIPLCFQAGIPSGNRQS